MLLRGPFIFKENQWAQRMHKHSLGSISLHSMNPSRFFKHEESEIPLAREFLKKFPRPAGRVYLDKRAIRKRQLSDVSIIITVQYTLLPTILRDLVVHYCLLPTLLQVVVEAAVEKHLYMILILPSSRTTKVFYRSCLLSGFPS